MSPAAVALAVAALAMPLGGRGAHPAAVRTTLYFLTDDDAAPIGVRHTIPRRSPFARAALEALLSGPTPVETRAGNTSAIPRGTKLLSFPLARSDALVDLAGLPPAQTTGAVTKVRVITQVTRTLVGLSDVRRVWLRNDGRPWGLWDMRGNVLDLPHDYDELLGFYDICSGAGDCFTALP